MSTRPPRPPGDQEQGLRPTRLRDLAAIAVFVGFVAWILVRYNYGDLPPLPLLAGIVLYVLAALEVVIAVVVRNRVEHRDVGRARGQLHPLAAARVLALAKASAILGAVAVGVWSGLLVFLMSRHDLTGAAHDRPGAVVGLVGGVLLVAAAVWLEHCCRTPDDPDEEPVDGHADPV